MLPITTNNTNSTTNTNRLAGLTADSSPFVMLDEVRREFDRVFDRMLGSWNDPLPVPRLGVAPVAWFPAMDVQETDNEFRLSVEIPGLDPDDVRVDVTDDTLTISGEKRVERDETNGAYRLVERRTGRFERRLTLPNAVDTEHVAAEYENGVLTVTVPKRADATKARRIEIKSSVFQKLLGRGRKDADGQKRETAAQPAHA